MNDATSTIALLELATGAAPVLLGAGLAVIGGWIGYEIRAVRQDRRELRSIKVVLDDELYAIETTINTMHETWTQSNILYPNYLSDLSANTSSFENVKPRLFLIQDDSLRREINAFYKKFKDLLKKSDGKVGTLADTDEARNEQTRIHNEYESLGDEACTLREKIKKIV